MLGRGLESLIPPNRSQEIKPSLPKPQADKESVFQIEVDKIKPNPHQPRRAFDEEALNELAASIREMGIIQPLIVSKIEKETLTGTEVEYQLIAGERRLQAAKKAGLERVPAIIRAVKEDKEKLEMAIVENIQRADLNPIEAARSYAKLQEAFGLTQREIAARVGKSRETISNVTRLLNLPTHIQDAIAEKKISDGQGRLLLAISDATQQQNLFEEIVRNNLSIRELKTRIARINKIPRKEAVGDDPELIALEEKLREALGTKVSLQKTTDGGRLTINFFSPEELREIIRKLLTSDDAQLT